MFFIDLMNLFSPFQGTTFVARHNPCEWKAKNLCFPSREQMDIPASFSVNRVIDDFDNNFLTEIILSHFERK